MLETVDVGTRSLAAYRGIAPDTILDEIEQRAASLRGARVVHLNATPYGGGVSELLRSLVPLLSDLGVVAEWKVISGDEEFFRATKRLHNALQGAESSLDEDQRTAYERTARRNAQLLEEEYDLIVVHDPQPAAILSFHGKGGARWIWRCHIDTSSPNPAAWEFLRGYLAPYDAAVFTMLDFVPPDAPFDRVEVIPPAIDPLSPKNLALAPATAREVLSWIGVEPDRPLISQVSRFDPWKDPLGVIDAYRLARESIPNLELALAGSMALDDPEGWRVYREIMAASERDPLIHVFTNLTGVGNIEINAFQRLSDICVQKSLREGFGLVVSEALWKGTPLVAGRAGGIPLQMADGVGGLLVDSVEECAQGIVALHSDPERARELGQAGRERVREHFLLPRLLLNELTLLDDLLAAHPRSTPTEGRDPVCGMALPAVAAASSETVDGRIYRFCSDDCQARFRIRPERYLPGGVSTAGVGKPSRTERREAR